jgi:hypothetical protein
MEIRQRCTIDRSVVASSSAVTVIADHDSRKIDANVISTAQTNRLIHHHSTARLPGNSASTQTRLAPENSATSVTWAANTARAMATMSTVIMIEASATVSAAAARSSDGLWLNSASFSQPAARIISRGLLSSPHGPESRIWSRVAAHRPLSFWPQLMRS